MNDQHSFIVSKSRSKTIKTGLVFTVLTLIAYLITTSIQFSAIFGVIAIIYLILGFRNRKILMLNQDGIYHKSTFITNWDDFKNAKIEAKNYSAGEADYLTNYLQLEYFDQNKKNVKTTIIEVCDLCDNAPDDILEKIDKFHNEYIN